jgi:hypothetical protein
MRQENATATRHVDDTVSIVSTIRDSRTRKVMWDTMVSARDGQYYIGMSHVDPSESGRTNMPSIEAVIAGAVRSALEIGNGVLRSTVSTQDQDVVRRADFGTWVTLCLMPDIGSRERQGNIMLLDMSNRMDNGIG